MSPDDFRRLALGMPEAVEHAHMGHPDFRAHGRIFATIYPDGQRGMVKLSPDQQRTFMGADPAAFEPASGAWGRQGCTTVQLHAIDEATLQPAMVLAWQATRAKARSGARPKATGRSKANTPSKTAARSKTTAAAMMASRTTRRRRS